jgi:hypothetical protein
MEMLTEWHLGQHWMLVHRKEHCWDRMTHWGSHWEKNWGHHWDWQMGKHLDLQKEKQKVLQRGQKME